MSYIISQLKNLITPVMRNNYRILKYKLFKERTLNKWKKSGCPVPPPHIVKQEIIREYASKYNLKILVETGTYLGDMVAAQKKYFTKIYSIELSNELWQRAKKRFEHHKNIKILQGDSSIILSDVVYQLNEPALYYLDGHYSGGMTAKGENICPIFNELKIIFDSKIVGNVVLIDDARLFNGRDGYPTSEDLINFVRKFNSNSTVKIEHDIIRLVLDNSNKT